MIGEWIKNKTRL